MHIEMDEDVVLAHLLTTCPIFSRFHKEERLAKVGFIRWFRDFMLPEGVEAYADVFEGAIYFGTSPVSINDAHTMAHEIMHLIRYQENSVLEITPVNLLHIPLVILLNSMLEDPFVDKVLHTEYKFDLCASYQNAIAWDYNHTETESDDFYSRLRRGVNLADFLLRWDLIGDPDARGRLDDHLNNWYKIQYPYSYEIGVDITNIVRNIGLGPIENHKAIIEKLIDKYNLQDVILV